MSFPNGVRLSDSIASKLIEGGFPVDLDGLRFSAALNIWEFVPFGGGGGAGASFLGTKLVDTTLNLQGFGIFNLEIFLSGANEANNSVICNFALTITRIFARCRLNSKNGATIFQWRDDAATVASVTIGAALTGDFDSGVLSVAVATGSRCNFGIDTTASSGGNIACEAMSSEITA